MKVTDVRMECYEWPRARPIRNGRYVYPTSGINVVKIDTDEGVTGVGLAAGVMGDAAIGQSILSYLRQYVVGQDPFDTERVWDDMWQPKLVGRRGITTRVISGIDIALWDLVSRDAGLPLYRYLGGYREDTVPAYASGGYYRNGKSPDELGREMRDYLDMGFRAVKMKVGRVPPSGDAVRIGAAREAVGPDVPLFLDANNGWPDAATAIRAIHTFEEYEPGWIEEPLMPDDIQGHAAIAASVATPVATGEIHATRWDFLQLVQQQAAAILQPDAGVCGGITEFRKIAAVAAAYDLRVAPHWLADVHVHLVASTPNADWVEYFTDFSVINLGRLFNTALELAPGGLKLPYRPGLGVELDGAAVGRYSDDGWG